MPFSRHQFLKQLASLFDLTALMGSFVFAVFEVYSSSKALTMARLMSVRVTLGNCLLFAMLMVIWHSVFFLCGLYLSKRLTPWYEEAAEVFMATSLAAVALLLSGKILHIGIVRLALVLTFWLCCTFVMVLGRLIARPLLRTLRRRGKNSRFLLIVGTNERAIQFANKVIQHPEYGYKVVGFVDGVWEGLGRFEETGHIRCCDFRGLAEFLRHNVVDEAAIYLPLKSYYEHAAQLVAQLEQHGTAIRFNSQVFNFRCTDIHSQGIDEHSHLVPGSAPQGVWSALIKRVMDFVLSIVLLVLVSPLLALVSILIKLTSNGPVLFRQVRVGLNKRQFKMYKFRTMVEGAEQIQDQLLSMNEMTGPAFKMRKDPRVTPIGRILRKTSIDELPQLLNVIIGDMSLVGPRAMSLRDYQFFDQDWQRRRFSVKPGITCLWQIEGRNSIPFERWMELDMEYIDRWSLWLDVKILARTVPVVLRGTGAS